MSELWEKVLEGKRKSRQQLANLSFEEKIAITEKLRDRSLLIASSQLRKQAMAAAGEVAPCPGEIQVSAKKRD